MSSSARAITASTAAAAAARVPAARAPTSRSGERVSRRSSGRRPRAASPTRRRRVAGRHERELVVEVRGVLDGADHGPRRAVGGQRRARHDVERHGHAVGHGHLARTRRQAPLAECEQRRGEVPARVLCPVADAPDRAGHRRRPVQERVDVRDATGGGDVGAQRARVRAAEPQHVRRRAEARGVGAAAVFQAPLASATAAATASTSRARTSACDRHSARNRRHAQRNIMRLPAVTAPAAASRGLLPERSGRRGGRRAGRRRGPPTTRAGRRG